MKGSPTPIEKISVFVLVSTSREGALGPPETNFRGHRYRTDRSPPPLNPPLLANICIFGLGRCECERSEENFYNEENFQI